MLMAAGIDNIPKTNRMIVTDIYIYIYIHMHIHIICKYYLQSNYCALLKNLLDLVKKERVIYSCVENNLNSISVA